MTLTKNRKLILQLLAENSDGEYPPHSVSSLMYSLVMTESEKIDGIDVPELAWLQVGLLELSSKVHYGVD